MLNIDLEIRYFVHYNRLNCLYKKLFYSLRDQGLMWKKYANILKKKKMFL